MELGLGHKRTANARGAGASRLLIHTVQADAHGRQNRHVKHGMEGFTEFIRTRSLEGHPAIAQIQNTSCAFDSFPDQRVGVRIGKRNALPPPLFCARSFHISDLGRLDGRRSGRSNLLLWFRDCRK